MSFQKAAVTPNGDIELVAGESYFIDVPSMTAYREALDRAISEGVLTKDEVKDVIPAGRSWEGKHPAMISFSMAKGTTIPNSIARLTGYFYILPPGGLREVQTTLYGQLYNEPAGFWYWFTETFPDALPIAEAVKDFEDEALDVGKKIGNIGLAIGGAALMIALAIIIGKQSPTKAAYR